MKTLHIGEVEYISYRLAKDILDFNEPIPPFNTRFPGILESCLAQPFQQFLQKDAYPGLVGKAAILLYLMIKNHPFQNGNKRIALTTMLTFLRKNKKWIRVDPQELYTFTMWVASSPAQLKNEVVAGIETFIRNSMVSL